jgi:hypothetical protein
MATSIGITTGVAYCGNVGSSLRKEYAAVGDTVNLSARLMSKAHGRILIDEATYSRLPKYLRKKRLTKFKPMLFKGKDVPMTPYACKIATNSTLDDQENDDVMDDQFGKNYACCYYVTLSSHNLTRNFPETILILEIRNPLFSRS